MNVLVTGASGFIGQALTAELGETGHVVYTATRREPGPGQAQIDLVGRTLDTSRLPSGDLSEIDVVFHLAGEPITPIRWSPKKRERIRSSRITSTDIVARAIARSSKPPATFICASAIGIYGVRDATPLDEDSPAGDGFLADVCRAWESAAAPATNVGTRVVNVRSGVVLGAGGGALSAQIPMFRFGLGGRLGNGKQWMSWISLRDEVRALIYCATTPSIVGPCNLTAPNPVTNAAFTKAIATALHRPAIANVPRPALRLFAGRQAASEFLLASQRVYPKKLLANGFSFDHETVATAIEAALHPDASAPALPHAGSH